MSLNRSVSVYLLAILLTCAGCAESEIPDDTEQPAAAVVEQPPPPAPAPLPPWVEKTVSVTSGSTIARILQDNGLQYSEALALVKSARDIRDLSKIRIGDQFIVRVGRADDSFHGLVYPLDRHGERKLLVERSEELGFAATELIRETRRTPVTMGGLVQGSLWATREALGLSAANMVGLASIFEWEIDFNTQVRVGDSFTMVVEDVRDAQTDEHIRYGQVLAAEYVNSGNAFRGYRFVDSAGHVGYYNEGGMSTKKMFLKSPLKFSRISSGFSKRRFHPVLKRWRSHNGVDYAASRGTPVRAIGNGRVKFTGKKGGYGKHVRIQHNGKYGSSYSHLSRIAVRRGQAVTQGTIIGHVGSTGLATGPHLHFEFYVHGAYTNFLAQKFARTEPIAKKERAAFEAELAGLQPLLESAEAPVATASRGPTETPSDTVGEPQAVR